MTISPNISPSLSPVKPAPVKFEGITIMAAPDAPPEIFIQGPGTLDPFGEDAININSAVVGTAPEVGALVKQVVAGNLSGDQVRKALVHLFKIVQLDHDIHQQPERGGRGEPMKKAMTDLYAAIRHDLSDIARKGSLTEPNALEAAQIPDVRLILKA